MTKEERICGTIFFAHIRLNSQDKKSGKNIVDLYSAQAKLIIELDGSQNYDDNGISKYKERTAYLEQYGLKILRIPNNQVNQNFIVVCEYIDNEVKQSLRQN